MSSREIKILLVDDEAEILYALKAVIETQGWIRADCPERETGIGNL